MINDLQKARKKVQLLNIELEKKVAERTEKLRMAREQLLQSEKMASLGVLASSVAHEINNPLQGIITYIKLMIKIIKGNKIDKERVKDFHKYLNLMGDETQRCGEIVNNLLVFSRQSKPDIKKADVNDIINNSILLLDNKIRIQNIDIILNLQENIPYIYCDFKQIQQTLIGLIINSIEAMQSSGKITITTETLNGDNNKVVITIADTGTGISQENLKNIFDPFFSTKEDAKSTGLGLFVAYGIIKEHRGTIEVNSEVGKGTQFHITLPAEDIDQLDP